MLFTFPSRYYSLSVSREYLALPDGPGCFAPDFSCPELLRIPLGFRLLRLRGYHPLCRILPSALPRILLATAWSYNPRRSVNPLVWAVPRSLATTQGITSLFSLPAATKMFQFAAFAHSLSVSGLQPDGLPHSEISGSKVICTSPKLIAAYHVLLRLREPRHPPVALSYFFYIVLFLVRFYPTCKSKFTKNLILRLSFFNLDAR